MARQLIGSAQKVVTAPCLGRSVPAVDRVLLLVSTQAEYMLRHATLPKARSISIRYLLRRRALTH